MESSSLFWIVTMSSFLMSFVPFIVNLVVQIFYQESESEWHLRRQISYLKSEQQSINMVDEFAKYAKIQRKVHIVTDELNNQSSIRSTSRIKLKFAASIVLYVISVEELHYCSYCGNMAVKQFWKFRLIGFGISTTFWLAISSSVANMISRTVQ